MTAQSIQRLQYLCDTIPQLLNEIDDHIFSLKPGVSKWSKKEIIGHLIDSAVILDDYVQYLEHHLKQVITY